MTNEPFLDGCIREFRRLRRLGERATEQMSDSDYFRSPGPGSNCAAHVVKHLSGNMSARWRCFPESDGEEERDRDAEFITAEDDTRDRLETNWQESWETLFSALESIGEDDLGRPVVIRQESHTLLQAIQRQLVHCAYHVGQMVFVARLTAGGAWQPLSIPRGESRIFNDRPGRYLASS